MPHTCFYSTIWLWICSSLLSLSFISFPQSKMENLQNFPFHSILLIRKYHLIPAPCCHLVYCDGVHVIGTYSPYAYGLSCAKVKVGWFRLSTHSQHKIKKQTKLFLIIELWLCKMLTLGEAGKRSTRTLCNVFVTFP